jgi:hypothetical protein
MLNKKRLGKNSYRDAPASKNQPGNQWEDRKRWEVKKGEGGLPDWGRTNGRVKSGALARGGEKASRAPARESTSSPAMLLCSGPCGANGRSSSGDNEPWRHSGLTAMICFFFLFC